jgi:crotonobetainyl-CoA:carnitine CoA-transferase CaiB-like acyl-CoA transferase
MYHRAGGRGVSIAPPVGVHGELMSSHHPLEGIRVIDLADERGELCGRLLADFGADVIRVEPPSGARSRHIPPFHAGQSLYYAYRNFNKRGLTLDLGTAAGRDDLHGLLAGADILVESGAPGRLARLGLDPTQLLERHPHLVLTSISDFGQTGPYRDWVGTDAVLEAMGGVIFKAGLPDKPPLIPPVAMAYDVAGSMAAWASLLAWWQRERTGHGQHIDVSVLEAVAQTTDWSFSNASFMEGRGQVSPELRMGSGPIYTIYACKGGYVRLIILSPRQWRAMWEWLGRPEAFADPHWEVFLNRLTNADVLNALYSEHFASMTMEEVSAEAQRRGIVCTPVLRPEEVLANEHFASRGTFADVEVAKGVSGPTAVGFHELDGRRMGFRRRAPEPGEHSEEVLSEASAPRRPAPSAPRPPPSAPLAGLRVLDFGIGGVGVEAGRLLAEYGADVIKIESRTYPDFIRVIMSTEMSASFASSSRSKRGFGVNLKTPEGRAVLHRLVKRADVVIENNSTGTMDALGVGYEALKALNPRIVMVSSQLVGSWGAWKDWLGYGPSTQPMSGLVHLWSYADQEAPAGSMSIFPDHYCGRLVALNALVGLIDRERTGVGCHGEVAQVEAAIGIMGDLLLKAGLEPGSVVPRGNRSERGVPWGAYPCEGEQQWCVITVRDDADWAGLRTALGDPAWAAAPELASVAGRRAREDEIDARLAEWTRARSKERVAETLQREGVPCGPMLTGGGQLHDPHFGARGYPLWLEQQDAGRMAFEGAAFYATGMTEPITFQAPRLGEHTREICRELLGMDEAEIDALLASGALEGPLEADSG